MESTDLKEIPDSVITFPRSSSCLRQEEGGQGEGTVKPCFCMHSCACIGTAELSFHACKLIGKTLDLTVDFHST